MSANAKVPIQIAEESALIAESRWAMTMTAMRMSMKDGTTSFQKFPAKIVKGKVEIMTIYSKNQRKQWYKGEDNHWHNWETGDIEVPRP